jgi:hypothetical protein
MIGRRGGAVEWKRDSEKEGLLVRAQRRGHGLRLSLVGSGRDRTMLMRGLSGPESRGGGPGGSARGRGRKFLGPRGARGESDYVRAHRPVARFHQRLFATCINIASLGSRSSLLAMIYRRPRGSDARTDIRGGGANGPES